MCFHPKLGVAIKGPRGHLYSVFIQPKRGERDDTKKFARYDQP